MEIMQTSVELAEILGSTIAFQMVGRVFASVNQGEALTAIAVGLNDAFNRDNDPIIDAVAKGISATIVNLLERGRDAVLADGPFVDGDEMNNAPATIGNAPSQEPLQACDKERILEQSRDLVHLADEVLQCTFRPAKECRSVFLEVSRKAKAMTEPVFRLDDHDESVLPPQQARNATNGK